MINSFRGKHRFLSNSYPAEVYLDLVLYPTVKHAYHAAKFKSASDRTIIRRAKTPGEDKRRSRDLSAHIRPDWDDVKLSIMEDLVRQKFQNHLSLRLKLQYTGHEELIEGNTWGDTFWGVCSGRGSNHLGRLLMKIRGELQNA